MLAKPYGNVLIMSPWNYPLLLTIGPLVDALAAGNTAVVKPSAYSPNVSHAIAKLLGDTFAPEYVAVIEGGRNENTCGKAVQGNEAKAGIGTGNFASVAAALFG